MQFIDLLFIIIVAGFGMFGLWFGLVHTIGSLLGTLAGAFIAGKYYEPMADWLVNITGWDDNSAKVFMFIVAFVVVNRLVGFAFWIVDKLTSFITRLPFINGINRFMGAILGVFEGIITLGLILFFIDKVPLSPLFMEKLADSTIAPALVAMAGILIPLLPDALVLLDSTIDYVEDAFLGIIESATTPPTSTPPL